MGFEARPAWEKGWRTPVEAAGTEKGVTAGTGGVEAEVGRRSPVQIERCPEQEELAEESWTEDLSATFPMEIGVES